MTNCPLSYERVRRGQARANELSLLREFAPETPISHASEASHRALARMKAARAVVVPLWARPVRKWYTRRQLAKVGL